MTSVAEQPRIPRGAAEPRRRRAGAAICSAPAGSARAVDDAALRGDRLRHRRRVPLVGRLRAAAARAESLVTVSALTAAPVGFLAGLGAFDYWVHYFLGKPTLPEDHSGHGATQLEGLLPDQHRPQGHRDPVRLDDDRLLPRRRPARDARPRRARRAGHAVHRHGDLQRPLLGARLADDLPVRDPGLRRARELRHPADDRRAGHGVPAPERAVVLDAADRGDDDAGELLRRGRRRSRPAGPATRRCRRRCRSGRRSSTWPSSGRARRRS